MSFTKLVLVLEYAALLVHSAIAEWTNQNLSFQSLYRPAQNIFVFSNFDQWIATQTEIHLKD